LGYLRAFPTRRSSDLGIIDVDVHEALAGELLEVLPIAADAVPVPRVDKQPAVRADRLRQLQRLADRADERVLEGSQRRLRPDERSEEHTSELQSRENL